MNLAMAMKDQPNDGTVIGMAVTETLGYNMRRKRRCRAVKFHRDHHNGGFPDGGCLAILKGVENLADVVAAAKSVKTSVLV